MPPAQASTGSFSIGEARHLVRDLFQPHPVRYWADFLLSMGLAAAAFFATPRLVFWPWGVLAYMVSVLGFYRGVLFTHELVHFRKGTFRGFRVAWNVLCGIPFLIPSKTYEMHVAHHARRHYGTPEDGEYLPFAGGSWRLWTMYLSQPFLMPVLAVFRFGILVPVSWFSRTVRDWAHRHLSSMVIDPNYVRPLPSQSDLRAWRLQEICCFLVILEAAVGTLLGWLPWHLVPRAYLVSVGVLMLNNIRSMGAHRFRNLTGEEMTFSEQLLDSLNFPRHGWISELWGPVGLRFHALHHLFPAMPYHHLPEAHRRLMAQLPADSLYRQTECSSLTSALWQLWQDARAARQARTTTRPRSRPNSRRAPGGGHRMARA